jgi:cytochrome c556
MLAFALSACLVLNASAQNKASADYAVNQRVVIHATAEEQAHVLTEMNAFLSSLHIINAALATKDFELIAKTAQRFAPNYEAEKPAIEKSFESKIPPEWRVFSSPMRKGFAEVAKAARTDPSIERIVAQLGKVTQNCVACHATFKIVSQ